MARPPATCHPNLPHQAKGLCSTCYTREWQKANPERMKAKRAALPQATCHPHKKVRARGLCDACYRREWRKENPERNRLWQQGYQRTRYNSRTESERRAIMLGRYGITEADYDRMLAEQGGLCKACGLESDRRLQVDHCHGTGVIRGLLCGNCNSVLGHAKDNPERLRALIAYLESVPSPPEPALSLFD